MPSRRPSTGRGHCSPSTWSWQVILGFPSRPQRRRARWCAARGAPTTRSRPVPSARFASPSAACSSAVTLRARTGVQASSFILEAGGSTPPWPALRGSTTPRIARPLRPRWCVLRSSNRPLPIHRSRIDRVLFAISSRRLLIFSSSGCDDLELPRHLRRDVHMFASAHVARGRSRGDRERAIDRDRACGRPGPGLELGPVRTAGAHVGSW